jgi:cell division protein FtsL
MTRIAMSKLSFLLFIHFLICAVSAVHLELEPLNKHKQRSSFRKRAEDTNVDYSALDLQSEGIFLWGVEGRPRIFI